MFLYSQNQENRFNSMIENRGREFFCLEFGNSAITFVILLFYDEHRSPGWMWIFLFRSSSLLPGFCFHGYRICHNNLLYSINVDLISFRITSNSLRRSVWIREFEKKLVKIQKHQHLP